MLNYKKPAFWAISIAVVISVFIAVCFMTNPKNNDDSFDGEDKTNEDDSTVNSKITKWFDYYRSDEYEWNDSSLLEWLFLRFDRGWSFRVMCYNLFWVRHYA